MTASLRHRVVSHCTVKTNSNNGEGDEHTRMPQSCQLLPQLPALAWRQRGTAPPLCRRDARFGIGELSREHRACVSAPYRGCPGLREWERERITLCNATVTPYPHMPPPVFPWPGAAAEVQKQGWRRGQAAKGNVSAAGRVWQGTHFGYPSWPSAMCAAGPGATGWRAIPGLEMPAHGCLHTNTQPGSMSPSAFGGRVFSCPAILSHLIFIWESQGVQEARLCPQFDNGSVVV